MNTNLHKKLSLFLLLTIALAQPLHASYKVPQEIEKQLAMLQDMDTSPLEKQRIITSLHQPK